jgi:hypothetical protein
MCERMVLPGLSVRNMSMTAAAPRNVFSVITAACIPSALRAATGGAPQGFKTIEGLRGATGMRFVDAFDDVTRVAREAKTGFTRLTQRQIDRDVLLRTRRTFSEVEWHFFGSSASETLGPSAELLAELRRWEIPCVIHLP